MSVSITLNAMLSPAERRQLKMVGNALVDIIKNITLTNITTNIISITVTMKKDHIIEIDEYFVNCYNLLIFVYSSTCLQNIIKKTTF